MLRLVVLLFNDYDTGNILNCSCQSPTDKKLRINVKNLKLLKQSLLF